MKVLMLKKRPVRCIGSPNFERWPSFQKQKFTKRQIRKKTEGERGDVGIICGKIYKHGLKMESERERKRNAQSFEKEVIRRTYSRKFLELTMK